jgi:glycosyltransferase involved in cell wall biosynthesis
VRVAVHTPLPPERSGIADYSYELFEELRNHLDIVAVVRDDLVEVVQAPEGVEVAGLSSVTAEAVDCDVYQMGNNPKYHRFFFQRAFERPGLLVLHDPSLADFHAEMCRSADSGVLRYEIAYDRPCLGPADPLPLVEIGAGQRDLDRLEVLLARRIVEANVRTLVHSSAIAKEMRRRYPSCDIATIQLPAPVLTPAARPSGRAPGEVVFGVFGGINYYKRIDAVVEAFRVVHREHPLARLVIAGRPDDREMTARLGRLAASDEFSGRLELRTKLSLAELEAAMLECDVVISLRWPTAGEMSATLMRAFGAGRPAVVTDVLQFKELDERFCWRVPVGEGEVVRLVEVMRAVAADPGACYEAGQRARRFVEKEATYRVISEQYVAHIEHCAHRRQAKAAALRPLTLAANAVIGVNLLEAHPPQSDGADAAAAIARCLRRAGVDVVERAEVGARADLATAVVERTLPARVVHAQRTLKAQRRAAKRGRRKETSTTPRLELRSSGEGKDRFGLKGRAASTSVTVGHLHDVDVCCVDARRAVLLAGLLRQRHRRGRRIVAVVAADALPPARSLERLLRHADEVWVPSTFSADVIAQVPLPPVVVIPIGIEPFCPVPDPRASQESPGKAEGNLIRALAVADASEGLAKSNPLAAVRAFELAFGTRSKTAELEVVVRHLDGHGEARRLLEEALGRVGGCLVEEDGEVEIKSRVASCDVFVSLHRTQAFGTWCATAMAAGKPVVATAYGGILDYASSASACLVGYELAELSEGAFYLDEPGEWGVEVGQRWASADVDQAAGWLRRLAANPSLRERIGRAARLAVEARLDEAAVGALMRARLETLVHRSPFDEKRQRKQQARLARASTLGVSGASGGLR